MIIRELRIDGLEVSEHQFPEIHEAAQACARILHMTRVPRLFVSVPRPQPIISQNAAEPVVILQSATLNRFSDQTALRFLIGREFGKIQAEQVRWLTLVRNLSRYTDGLSMMTAIAGHSLLLPALQFSRDCEMSADNAGLICAQDRIAAEKILIRLATGADGSTRTGINVQTYLNQSVADDLSAFSGCVAAWRKVSSAAPFCPERIRQLRDTSVSAVSKPLEVEGPPFLKPGIERRERNLWVAITGRCSAQNG